MISRLGDILTIKSYINSDLILILVIKSSSQFTNYKIIKTYYQYYFICINFFCNH